jgi:hypothetical protein
VCVCVCVCVCVVCVLLVWLPEKLLQHRCDLMECASKYELNFIANARWRREADHFRILVTRPDYRFQLHYERGPAKHAVTAAGWRVAEDLSGEATVASMYTTHSTSATARHAPPHQLSHTNRFAPIADSIAQDVPTPPAVPNDPELALRPHVNKCVLTHRAPEHLSIGTWNNGTPHPKRTPSASLSLVTVTQMTPQAHELWHVHAGTLRS